MGSTKGVAVKGLVVHERLDAAFPDAWLEKTARETGLVKRLRAFNVVLFFWVLVLESGVELRVSLEAIRRRYNEHAQKRLLAHASFYERFTPELVKFLHACAMRGLEELGKLGGRKLTKRVGRFRDIFIQDSTIIRLHEKLAKRWPATRSRKKVAAGVKLSCLLSVVADGPRTIRLFGERIAEVRTLRIGSWIKDSILLIDLGFFKYGVFDRIERNGGSFVSRLKENADPKITKLLRVVRGNSVLVEGERLRDVLHRLKREVLDVEVEVSFRNRAYRGKTTGATRRFRVVCVRDDETSEYHTYLTNLSADEFTAEEIAGLYGCRWEVERVFREMKNEYSLDMIPTANPNAVQALIWTGVLTLVVQRICFLTLRELVADRAGELSHDRFAAVFREKSAGVRLNEILARRGLMHDSMNAIDFELCSAFYAYREHSTHIREWRE